MALTQCPECHTDGGHSWDCARKTATRQSGEYPCTDCGASPGVRHDAGCPMAPKGASVNERTALWEELMRLYAHTGMLVAAYQTATAERDIANWPTEGIGKAYRGVQVVYERVTAVLAGASVSPAPPVKLLGADNLFDAQAGGFLGKAGNAAPSGRVVAVQVGEPVEPTMQWGPPAAHQTHDLHVFDPDPASYGWRGVEPKCRKCGNPGMSACHPHGYIPGVGTEECAVCQAHSAGAIHNWSPKRSHAQPTPEKAPSELHVYQAIKGSLHCFKCKREEATQYHPHAFKAAPAISPGVVPCMCDLYAHHQIHSLGLLARLKDSEDKLKAAETTHGIANAWARQPIAACSSVRCDRIIKQNDDYIVITQMHDGRIGLGPLHFCSWRCALDLAIDGRASELDGIGHVDVGRLRT